MSPAGRRSLASLRAATAEGLRVRREEIHEAVIHRALSVAPPTGREAPGYVEALRAAIPAAVEHAFEVIELGEERAGPTPAPIFVQAAASARSKVGLEVVMRRYVSGYSTLSDFLHQEVRGLGAGVEDSYMVLQRELTALFERFAVEVSETYRREEGRALPSSRQRSLERVRRLLAGELIDPAGIDYPLDGSHLAMVLSGTEPEAAAGSLAVRLDRRLLIGESSSVRCAIWLGGLRPTEEEELDAAIEVVLEEGFLVSLGEPGEGLAGWRRSLRQAEAAHLVAERSGRGLFRYREVALLAAALRDPDLAHFLTEAFGVPLEEDRLPLRETLVAFLAASWNASSAAATLGVTRHTVTSRLRVVEERLGRPLADCAPELGTALRLQELP
jgi:hypothetical protein